MKLEVGQFVRTNDGVIFKIKNIVRTRKVIVADGDVFDDYELKTDEIDIAELIKWYEPKASFNIIDLIEVGDFVHGMKVKNIMSVGTSQYVIRKGDGKYVCCGEYGKVDDGSGKSCYALQWNNNQITSILTKELYEANCYKVVE